MTRVTYTFTHKRDGHTFEFDRDCTPNEARLTVLDLKERGATEMSVFNADNELVYDDELGWYE